MTQVQTDSQYIFHCLHKTIDVTKNINLLIKHKMTLDSIRVWAELNKRWDDLAFIRAIKYECDLSDIMDQPHALSDTLDVVQQVEQ
jgi:hypothetical protein